ncbi:Cell surface protein [Acidisarcina polymorpha]|uniref:Cell surface protein n=1 Tax=Acidisarcina polymorpha TaxID=2211140 RepID=A0A2Z5G214_9BACT|nr:SBBP repeat-containing protein [Acidisarcina polymorpha]AXC13141.1 Cell surface protein [Acidisarcina polymorpha]
MKTLTSCAAALLALGQFAASAQISSSSAFASQPTQNSKPSALNPAVTANFAKLPLSFEANQGQTDSQVRFVSRGQGYSLFLTNREAVLALHKNEPQPVHGRDGKPALSAKAGKTAVVRMELDGASDGLRVVGEEPLPGKSNYFIGSDSSKWHTNVPTYSRVKYTGVYPGIDLVYYGNQQQLEYDFVVAPNADPKQARLHFAGADKLKLNHDGDLEIIAKEGEIAFHKPVVYQMKDGQRQPVIGSFRLLAKNTVGFELGSYDRSRELVVDPVLAYSTYLGGTQAEYAEALAVDQDANVYVTGENYSTDFPLTKHPLEKTSTAVYLTKLNQTGTALDYSTYFVSDVYNTVSPTGLAVDAAGDAYLTGATGDGFPTTSGAFQTAYKRTDGNDTGFVAKVNSTGSALVYSTYLGGSGGHIKYENGYCQAIAVDAEGNAYVTGYTDSADFPVTKGAYQTTKKSELSAFVTKLNPEGTGLVYSTFLGGTSVAPLGEIPEDDGYAIVLNSAGEAYVGGSTVFTDFPTTANAFQTVKPSPGSSGSSGFVTKLNAAGSGLVFSTFLGGSNPVGTQNFGQPGDFVVGVAVDPQGNVFAVGEASSTDFPVTSNAIQSTAESTLDGFVTKLDPTGSALVYSTYLGGTSFTDGGLPLPGAVVAGVAVNKQGDAFVTGHTIATNFPVTSGAIQRHNLAASKKSTNAFLTEFDPGGSLLYSTYFGGNGKVPGYSDAYDGGDKAIAVALDSLGNAYIAGTTISSDFPVTPGAFQTQYQTSIDSDGIHTTFVAKFAFHKPTSTTLVGSSNPAVLGTTVKFTATATLVYGGTPVGDVSFSVDGPVVAHIPVDASGQAVFSTSTLSAGQHTITARFPEDTDSYSSSSATLVETITGGQVATPFFPRLGGTYHSGDKFAIEDSTPGATIYYTVDGTTPTAASTRYTSPILISTTTTIKAIAVVSGDTNSAVATATYTIVPAAVTTTTSLTSSTNPSTLGDAVTFTATVTAASGPTPTGAVTFKNDSVVLGTVPLTGGKASIRTSNLTVGGNTFAAIYTGNATDAASAATITQEVAQ